MRYYVVVNKPVRNIRIYRVVRRVNQETNTASLFFQKLVDRFFVKGRQQ